MKSILTNLINSIVKLLILLAVIILLGYLLFKYYQPLCEPCLPNTYCPPCLSNEQYVLLYVIGAISLLFLLRIFYLIIRKKRSNWQNKAKNASLVVEFINENKGSLDGARHRELAKQKEKLREIGAFLLLLQ